MENDEVCRPRETHGTERRIAYEVFVEALKEIDGQKEPFLHGKVY
jgi:hypothetical protein